MKYVADVQVMKYSQSLEWVVHGTTKHVRYCSAPGTPHQRTMKSCVTAEYVRSAEHVPAMHKQIILVANKFVLSARPRTTASTQHTTVK